MASENIARVKAHNDNIWIRWTVVWRLVVGHATSKKGNLQSSSFLRARDYGPLKGSGISLDSPGYRADVCLNLETF